MLLVCSRYHPSIEVSLTICSPFSSLVFNSPLCPSPHLSFFYHLFSFYFSSKTITLIHKQEVHTNNMGRIAEFFINAINPNGMIDTCSSSSTQPPLPPPPTPSRSLPALPQPLLPSLLSSPRPPFHSLHPLLRAIRTALPMETTTYLWCHRYEREHIFKKKKRKMR